MESDLRYAFTAIAEFLGLVLILGGVATEQYGAVVVGLGVVGGATLQRKRMHVPHGGGDQKT